MLGKFGATFQISDFIILCYNDSKVLVHTYPVFFKNEDCSLRFCRVWFYLAGQNQGGEGGAGFPHFSPQNFPEHKLICFPLFWSLQQIGAAGAAFHKPLSDYMNSYVKESFPNTPKDQLKILDAGAGTGPIGIELDKLGYTCVHALDISEEMLNVARKKGVPYKRFICTALTEKRVSEVETGEFDIVIAAGALIMANVRPEALVEIVRMVKKGELVFLSLREG